MRIIQPRSKPQEEAMRYLLTLSALALVTMVSVTSATAKPEQGEGLAQGGSFSGSIIYQPGDLKWGPGPDALPPGADLTVLDGDPFGEGPFTLRAKMPAGYRIGPH